MNSPLRDSGDTGSQDTYRCNAVYDSDLRMQIKWQKDGEFIDFETEPRFVQSSDQSLTITKTTELDSGRYTCKAENKAGAISHSASLKVNGNFYFPRKGRKMSGRRRLTIGSS